MVDMRDLIDKVSSRKLTEAYITGWGITDPHHIREHVIESLLEWYEDNGWQHGVFIDLLASYMRAIGARVDESAGMQALMKRAMRMIIKEFKEMLSDGSLMSMDWDERFQEGFDSLRQLGMNWPELATLEKHMHAMRAVEDAKYADYEDDEDEDEAKTAAQPQAPRTE